MGILQLLEAQGIRNKMMRDIEPVVKQYREGAPAQYTGAGPLEGGFVPAEQAREIPAIQPGDADSLIKGLIGTGNPEAIAMAKDIHSVLYGGRSAQKSPSAPTNLLAMRAEGINTGNPLVDALMPDQAKNVLGSIQPPVNVGDETVSRFVRRPEVTEGSYAKMKRLPPAINKGINENIAAARMLDGLVKATEKNPRAFGAKTVLPDVILQMADKQGVDLRADVANIGSLKIHDRSGAAVAAQEFPRLRPFIPSAGDSPQTVVTKLKGFQRELRRTLEEMGTGFGPSQGYVPHEGLRRYLSRKPEESDPLGIRQ